MVGLDQGVKSVRTTQAPGIPPLAPHASLGIDDAQAASLVVVLIGVGGWARPGQSSRLQYDTDTWHPAACPIQPG